MPPTAQASSDERASTALRRLLGKALAFGLGTIRQLAHGAGVAAVVAVGVAGVAGGVGVGVVPVCCALPQAVTASASPNARAGLARFHFQIRLVVGWRVLVPLDGSPLAEAALAPAAHMTAALAGRQAGALHLVRVIDVMDMVQAPPETFHAQAAEHRAREWALGVAKAYLSDVARRLRECDDLGHLNLSVTWSAVLDAQSGPYERDVAQTILRAAEVGDAVEGATAASRCDVIAMATHGRGGIARWALGSITERVLAASTLPALVVRPRTCAAETQQTERGGVE